MGTKTAAVLAIGVALAFVAFFVALGTVAAIAHAFNGPPTNCTPPNCSGAVSVSTSNNLGVGTTTTLSNTKLLIVASDTSSSNYALQIEQPATTPIFTVRDDGKIGIGTASPSYTLDVNGTVNATTLIGNFSGTVNANNVESGVFGSCPTCGGGIYSFPSSLGVATSSNSSLPQTLSVYGSGYFSGNVGIGTTNPQATLDIGTGSFTGGTNSAAERTKLDMANDTGFPSAAFVHSDGSKGAIEEDSLVGTNDIIFQALPTTTAGYGVFETWMGAGTVIGTGGTASPIIFRPNRIEVMRIQADGNVGIGTTNPAATLDVNGTVHIVGEPLYAPFNLPNTGGSAQWVELGTLTIGQQGKSALIKIVANAGYNASINQNFEAYIRFKTSNGGNVDANGFCADSDYYTTGENGTISGLGGAGEIKWVGNASGCSATAYTLYVYLPAYTGNNSFYTVETTGGSWTNSGATGQTDPGAASATVEWPKNELVTQSNIGVGGSPGSAVLYVNGNVGIGTTGPSYKLDVAGQIRSSSGGYVFPDGTVQTTAASSGGLPSITTFPSASTDFLESPSISYGPTPWAQGGTLASAGDIASTANHPGILEISTYNGSAAASSTYVVAIPSNAFLLAGTETATFIFRLPVDTSSSMEMGFSDNLKSGSAYGTENNAVDFWIYPQAANGPEVVKGLTRANGVLNGSVTGTSYSLSANTWYKAVVSVNSSATQVDFYLYDDGSGTQLWHDTLTTNIPTTATVGEGVMAGNAYTRGTSGYTGILDLDYLSYSITRTLTR